MTDWLWSLVRDTPIKVVFLAILLAGSIYTLFSLLFGGEVDTEADVDIGEGGEGPSFFGVRGLSLFATGFGAAGFIVYHFTEMVLVSSVAGFFGGGAVMVPGILLIRVFWQAQHSDTLRLQDYIDAGGTVTTSIPQDGLGEVTVNVKGRNMTKRAKTEDQSPIPSHSNHRTPKP